MWATIYSLVYYSHTKMKVSYTCQGKGLDIWAKVDPLAKAYKDKSYGGT